MMVLKFNLDVLRVRLPTSSIVEKIFIVNEKKLKFYDVAGQKDKRARWAPYFVDFFNPGKHWVTPGTEFGRSDFRGLDGSL